MTEKPWKSIDTRVYTGDGGFDICNLPNPVERAAMIVRAVNGLPEAIAALEGARARLYEYTGGFAANEKENALFIKIEAALTKLKG